MKEYKQQLRFLGQASLYNLNEGVSKHNRKTSSNLASSILRAAKQDVIEDSQQKSSASISDIKSTYSLLDPSKLSQIQKISDRYPKLMNEL